jgi:hypothetical protein
MIAVEPSNDLWIPWILRYNSEERSEFDLYHDADRKVGLDQAHYSVMTFEPNLVVDTERNVFSRAVNDRCRRTLPILLRSRTLCRMSSSSSSKAEAHARKRNGGGLPKLEISRCPDCACSKAALSVIISNDRDPFSDVQIRRLGKLPSS